MFGRAPSCPAPPTRSLQNCRVLSNALCAPQIDKIWRDICLVEGGNTGSGRAALSVFSSLQSIHRRQGEGTLMASSSGIYLGLLSKEQIAACNNGGTRVRLSNLSKINEDIFSWDSANESNTIASPDILTSGGRVVVDGGGGAVLRQSRKRN
ncbi:hypothetical protein J6590_041956 [Homalodisca vitripennis]|nr:hypothetical protein J6590_041953 [Homalodisca vitripennis]KAG8248371.1 hypothetical protein J6590_041956 [Homalodisca vitripennis]